jgi:hypothetical protein
MALKVQKWKVKLETEISVLVLRATKRALVTTTRKNLHQNELFVTEGREFPIVLHSFDVKIMLEQINK